MNSLLNEELFHKVLMTSNQVKKALIRISHEIYEKNDDFDNLILLGILTRGVHISNRIVETRVVKIGLHISLHSIHFIKINF